MLLLISFQSKAAWTQNGPEGGSFFIKENNGILYSTNAIGLYKSTDNGLNWNRVSTFTGFTMNDLVFTPNKMIASTNKGIFYSIDGGVNWVSSNQGLTNIDTTGLGTFQIFKTNSGRIITSAISGAYYSDNSGQNWISSSNGSTLVAITQTNSNLVACDGNGVLLSIDNGTSWQSTSNTGINPTDLSQIANLFYLNNSVYAGGQGIGVYKSSDNGNTWQAHNNGMSGVFYGNLLQLNNKLYKGVSQQGIYELDNSTNIWSLSSFAQNNINAYISGYYNGRYFGAVTLLHDDLMFTDNNGQTWQNTNGIKTMNVRKLSASSNLYTLGDLGGFLLDTNQLAFNRNTPSNQNYSANTYYQSGVNDIKKRSNGTIYLATAGGVWKSINNGASYTQSYNGLPFSTSPGTSNTYTVYDMFISGTFPNDTLLVGTTNGIYYSTDDAQTFTQVPSTNGKLMIHFLKHQGILYCAGTGVFKRTSPNNWSQFTTSNIGVSSFAAAGDYLFITANNSPVKYAHVNGLTNFANIITGSGNFAYSVAAYDTLVFYCSNNGVFKLNTTLLGSVTQTDLVQVADNLPYYFNPGNVKQYSYLNSILAGNKMAVFNGKLWLGTNGMSTFYRSLNDFGYSLTVSNKDNQEQKNGFVYPNPSNDKITMTSYTIGTKVAIYNSVGQLVLNMTYTNSQTIDLSKINPGLYTYLIIDNKQNIIDNGKFVKE
ncbi:MAG: T9SS type A sorting domain-containing protein [Bacteroidota bacterium]|jgi:photosystem II stability/assembly factor-like uncharacterized protein